MPTIDWIVLPGYSTEKVVASQTAMKESKNAAKSHQNSRFLSFSAAVRKFGVSQVLNGKYPLQNFVILNYRKVASSNTSRFEAHAGLFRLLMKGTFDAYVL